MSHLAPNEFFDQVIAAGETKAKMSWSLMMTRGFMGGALLAIAAVFAVSITHQTNLPIVGAALFPVGFCLIYLMGFDLVTGIFVLVPIGYIARQPTLTLTMVFRSFFWVFIANFCGAVLIALIMASVFTNGFSSDVSPVGEMLAEIGKSRTIGYKENGIGGLATVFLRAALCNWMVSLAVLGSFVSSHTHGKIMVMWMPIMVFFAMTFEHSVVNMFLFPVALLLGGEFSISDYLLWNEIPVLVGNLAGGLVFTALPFLIVYSQTRQKTLHQTSIRKGT